MKVQERQYAASVSEIEPLTRKGKTYYKLGLFVGFNERDLIEGTFTIPWYN